MTTDLNPQPGWGTATSALELQGVKSGSGRADEALDRQLIVESVHRYAWAYDERRIDLLRDVFTDDAVFIGSVGGSIDIGRYDGREAIVQWLQGHMGNQSDQRRHNILNTVIDDLEATSAMVASYLLLTSTQDGGLRPVTTGFYRFKVVKQEQSWRIREIYGGFDSAF